MNEREIFMAALDRESPDERTRYLGQACGNDRELRRRVEALLQSYADSGSFLERPVLADEETLGLDSITDRAGPPPRADDQADLPDPNSDPVSLDFLQPSDAPDSLGRLGQYEVRAVVGVGGMGVVLRAHDPKLNRIVAVKVMAPQFVVNSTARKRFLREAQAIAAVTHPHVIAIHAVDQTEKTPYLVMEFIDGLSLQEKIDRCGPLEVKEILRIGAQIAAGLAAAHAHGLVHRDIKPSNILLENGVERVRITDFGLARAVDDVGVTRSGEVTGTPQFMSPEQAQGKPVDHRSDLFSLGAVLYTMCTGRSPFRAETTVAVLRRVCDDVPRPIREVNPDIPEQLVAIIDRLLAKDPEERFQTAQEVSDLLMGYLAHLQDPANVPPPEPLSVRPATDRKTRAAGAARVGRWPRRALTVAAAVLLGLCVSVAVTEATGVTHLAAAILRIATGAGTLVVEVDDPQVSITIDGEDLVITGAGPQEVRLKPGQYRVQAAKGGQVMKQELVTIERGGRQVVRVALEPSVTPPAKEGPTARPYSLWSKAALAQRLDQLSKSIQANPREAGLLEERGRVCTHLGRYDEAARDFATALAGANSETQRWMVYDSAVRDDQVFSCIAAILPHDTTLRIARGRFFAHRGQWEPAVREYAPVIGTYGVGYATEHYARLLLLTGSDEEYRRLCQRLSAQFGETDDVATAYWLASICTAGPQSGIEPARIVRWAGQAVAATRAPMYLFALGAAHYRAGQYERAVECLEESNARYGTPLTPHNPFLLAMAYHRLGQHEKSRECYRIGIEVLRSRTPPRGSEDPAAGSLGSDGALSEWTHLNFMHREAKALLGLTEEPAPQTESAAPSAAPVKKTAKEGPTTRPYSLWSKAALAQRLDQLSKSIQANPREAGLPEERGRVCTHLGRYDEAARDFATALAGANSETQRWMVYDSAVRDDQVFSRIAAILPHDTALRIARGRFFAHRGQWERAVREYAAVVEPYGVNSATEHYARLLLLNGNDEEYRRLCQQLEKCFGETDTAGVAYLLVSVCTAGSQSGVEPGKIVRWGEQAVAASRTPLYLFALGAANYRAGQYERAVECLEESNVRWGSQRTAHNPFILAMAYHRLGQQEKSRECYGIGIEVLRSRTPPGSEGPPAGRPGSLWDSGGLSEWTHLNLMHREAKALLGLTEEPAPKTESAAPIAAPVRKRAEDSRANK